MDKAFSITLGRGFQMTFPNGYTISVQFGPGNYGENYDANFDDSAACGEAGSDTAETAIIHPALGLIPDPADESEYRDTVQGYQTVAQVLDRMQRVAAFPPV